jgi:ribosome-binding ATPase YchF (GTP1/OBG family)
MSLIFITLSVYVGPQAAAVIHSTFEKHYIRAEVVSYEDMIKYGSEDEAKRNNAVRVEGKDYIMKDGDVVHFLTSA